MYKIRITLLHHYIRMVKYRIMQNFWRAGLIFGRSNLRMYLDGDILAVEQFYRDHYSIGRSRKNLEGKILVVADESVKSAKISPLQSFVLYGIHST